jgi:hypothetical protein
VLLPEQRFITLVVEVAELTVIVELRRPVLVVEPQQRHKKVAAETEPQQTALVEVQLRQIRAAVAEDLEEQLALLQAATVAQVSSSSKSINKRSHERKENTKVLRH